MISISELFDIENGNGLALSDMQIDDNGVNFVARGENNNGVTAKVKAIKSITPFEPNQITVALSGSVLESFYQDEPFYTSYHIKILKPRKELTKNQMFYYCLAIKNNKYRYSYGRQANRTLDSILVPAINELPSWVNKVPIPKMPNSNPFQRNNVTLEDRDWKWFKLSDIFPDSKLSKCKCTNASSLLTKGNDILYIGAKKTDNGFMERVEMNRKLVSSGNGIVFIGDGQGSVGYATYQKDDFIGSSTLTVGYNDNLNEFTGLFLVTVLDLERYRYSFGRKYGKEQIKNTRIKLPATPDGKIDWNFMEYYVKSLPFSSNLENRKGLSDAELIAKYERGEIDLKKPIKALLKKPI